MENQWSRRQVIKGLSAMPFAIPFLRLITPAEALAAAEEEGTDPGWYSLPPLPYDYDALEPSIDKETLQIHHTKHHAGYVDKANHAVLTLAEVRKSGDYALIKHWSRELAFNGSGHILHTLYWLNMAPEGGGKPEGTLMEMIQRDFGSFEAFLDHFAAATGAVEGSGWGVLAYEQLSQKLVVLQIEKHQNLTIWGASPLLICDVWEHAYYLKYQNRRKEYIENFFKVVNWKEVARRHTLATGG